MTNAVKNILSIAGSDPSGGAGIQADLKTVTMLGGYGMAAITALTAQNTRGVKAVQTVDAAFIADQLEAVFTDIRVDAVKIGMLGDEHAAAVVADSLERYKPRHIVLDPVIVSTSGHRLTSAAAIEVIQDRLAPLASLVTPNLPEGEAFLKASILDSEKAARALNDAFHGTPVLLKGGHGSSDKIQDILFYQGDINIFETHRIQTKNTHGTGCTLSAALATLLAQGHDVEGAVNAAKTYLIQAMQAAEALNVGTGHGPLYHNYALAQDGS